MKRVNIAAISAALNSRLFFVEKTTSPTKKNRALNSIRIFDIITLLGWIKIIDHI
ncbi:MAG: hypothetical protein NZ775_02620 [Gammaproteobacteria bacterium]|nr:hypothetical protein [Gammaproteobacteria bacterium]